MLSCTYYAGMTDPPITEYLPVLHEGYAGQRAMEQLGRIAEHAQVHLAQHQTLDTLAAVLSRGRHPKMIEVKKDGRFHRVLRRQW
jgi:DNA repair protein RadD